MAKTPVSLVIDEFTQRVREVASFTMTYNQATDAEGQVTGLPRGGKIQLRLKALNNGNTDLVLWMTDKKKAVEGKIEFKDTTSGNLMKTINFKDAYCVSYTEHWEDSIVNILLAHYEDITISCREIKIGEMELFRNTWELIL
jgi:hypothetical protein